MEIVARSSVGEDLGVQPEGRLAPRGVFSFSNPLVTHFCQLATPMAINSCYSFRTGGIISFSFFLFWNLLLLLVAVQEVLAVELAVASGELAREGGRLVAQLVTSTLLSDLAVRDMFRRSWGSIVLRGYCGEARRERGRASYLRCSFLLNVYHQETSVGILTRHQGNIRGEYGALTLGGSH